MVIQKLISRLITPQIAQDGVFLMLATTGGSFFNFLYHFVLGRMLGPADYAALVALVSVLNIITAPVGVSQTLLSDSTARLLVIDAPGQVRYLIQKFMGGLIVGVAIFVAAMLLTNGQTRQFMHLSTGGPIVMLAMALGPAFFIPALTGVLQGWQDFRGMSLVMLFGSAARFVAGVGLVWIGMGVLGALGGFVVAGIVSLGIAVFFLWQRLSVPAQRPNITRLQFLQYSTQIALALLSYALLMNSDVVLARHFFLPDQAGHYSAVATLGKIGLFLPGPVAMLMFPKATARHVLGESGTKMLRISALATLGLSVVVAGSFTLGAPIIIEVLYGPAYAGAAKWLGLYGFAMIGTALVYLFMTYYLAAHDLRFVSILFGFAVAQLLMLTFLKLGPVGYIWVLAAASWSILVVAEIWLGGLRERKQTMA